MNGQIPETPTDPGLAPVSDPLPAIPTGRTDIAGWASLFQRQPLIALVGFVLLGGGAGTMGSVFVSPLVDSALAEHEGNDRAHDVDRLADRLDRIESKVDAQGATLRDVDDAIRDAVQLLKSR